MPSTKEAQLKKHKLLATGLFILMAVIYAVSTWLLERSNTFSWVGYIHAFAEAAMVGALADWFAVTALFRYPFGLKIPHTNIIETKKDAIGHNLGSFVRENFLTEENIRPYIEKINVSEWASQWLSNAENQSLLLKETNRLIHRIIEDIPEKEAVQLLATKAEDILFQLDYKKLAARGLQYVLENDEQNKLLNLLLPKIKNFIQRSQPFIRERINTQNPLIGFLVGKKISNEFIQGLTSLIDEIEKDSHHWARTKITKILKQLQSDLLQSDRWDLKINNWKTQLITTQNITPYIQDIWLSLRNNLLSMTEDHQSKWNSFLQQNMNGLIEKLHSDPVFSQKLNSWVKKYAYTTILRNRVQVESLISKTVEHWNGEELSRKLELEVGKDLQYIRVNGTVVGGLVGLLIYTLTRLLFQ